MSHPSRLAGLTALALIGLAPVCSAQTSEYYVMAGDQGMFHVLQGGALVRSWATASGTAQYQYALVVTGTVRTMGANQSDVGAQYDLNGNDLGPRYTHPTGPGRAWDGTTDGVSFYAIDSAGMVFRFDQSWGNPVSLFDAGGIGSLTYDPGNGSLWVSQFSSATITEYTLSGTVLSTFSTGHTRNMALALDHADGTLWLHDRNTQGTFEQWTKAGVMLNRIAIAGMSGQNALGGEMPFLGGAMWTSAGGGCPGSNGTPALAVAGLPTVGSTFALDANNLAGGAAFMVMGLGQQALPLQPFGFGFGPNCTLLVNSDAVQFLVQQSGTASWSLAVPNDPGLAGLHLYNQVVELGTMSAVSNAGDGLVQ